MRMFIVLLILSLITYSSSAVTEVALDLKASQSVNTGSNVAFKITVTVSGGDATATNDLVTIKAIAGLELVKSDAADTKSTVTCTLSEDTEVVRGTPQDFDCTAQSLTTAGTYKLAEGDAFKLTDDQSTEITTAAVTGTATMEVKAATGGDTTTPTTGGNTTNTTTTGGDTTTTTTGSGKFLAVSSLFTLLLFF